MTRYLIDSDAFHAMRKLGLLSELCRGLGADRPLIMVGQAAYVELNPLQAEIASLKAQGFLIVHEVIARSGAGQRAKELRRSGVDKGEAEAIAWATQNTRRNERPLFVTLDSAARKHAEANRLIALDLMDAIVDWIEEGILDRGTVARLTVVWDDRTQEIGRPRNYDGFESTYSRRLLRRNTRLGH